MGSLSGIVGGIIGSGQKLPTIDVSGLMQTIQNAGVNQRAMINGLPDNVKKLLEQYQATTGGANTAYQNGIAGVDKSLTTGLNGIYGPDTDAANAQKNADKTAIYSTVPGTADAVRNAMAATGGLGRGNAGVQLAQPYVNAAQQYGQAAAGVDASQTAQAQAAQKQALTAVASMDAAMFQQVYGMTQQQAQQILSSGNAALSTQLADLINQSNNQTNQTLSVEGIAANNGYQNAVTRNAQQGAIWNGLADTALQEGGVMDSSGGMNNPISGENSIMNNWAKFGGGSAATALA